MSKQKQLRNRLNDLFADMGEETAEISKNGEGISGWTWECDAEGQYVSCSPEVEEYLGVEPADFLGQSLASFRLSPQSVRNLSQVMGSDGEEGAELTLQIEDRSGTFVPIRMHLVKQADSGWRGFTQLIKTEREEQEEPIVQESLPPASPPEPSQPSPQTDSARLPARIPHFQSGSYGLAVEENDTFTVSEPYSGAGKQSLKQRQTISHPSAPGIEAALAVPIALPDQSLGLLEVIDPSLGREWNEEEQRLVEEIADQLSLALENARLFEETQISLSRTEALFEVSRAAIAFEDITELLQSVADTIAAVLPAQRTLVMVCDLEREQITHFFESNAPPIPIGENSYQELMNGLSGWCLREKKPALSLKRQVDQRESEIARQMRVQSGDGSVVVVPMIYHDQVLGTLTAINTQSQPDFTQSDVDLLSAMSNQVATALANANILRQEQRRRQIASTLSEIARVIGGSLDLRQIAERLLAQLSDVLDFDTASLQIIEGDLRQQIGSIRKSGQSKTGPQSESLRPISEDPLIRSVVESKHPLVLANTKAHPLWNGSPENAQVRSWVAAPLLRGEEVIGLLILNHSVPSTYDAESADLLSAIAAQAAVAIHNARLYQQAQDRSRQLQTAAEVSRAASSILDPNPLITQSVSLIRERFGLYYVGLFLVDERGTWTREPGKWAVLRAGTGEAGRIQIERNHKLEIGGTSMIGQCVALAQPQISQQVTAEEQRFANPLLPETRSELALPLISRGQVIGAMTIQSTKSAAFTDEDIAILQTMADQVGNALQNANLFDQIQARAEELAVLNEMSRQLTATVDVSAITRNIYLFTSRLIDTSTFFIGLFDEGTNLIHFPLATEDNQEILIPARRKGQGLTEYVLESHEPLLLHENVDGWLRDQGVELIPIGTESETQIAQSWLGVPMLLGDTAIGVIGVQNNEPHHYDPQDEDLLMAIASQGAIAFQNASLFEQIQQRSVELQLINRVVTQVAASLDLNESLQIVADEIGQVMKAGSVGITLLNEEHTTLTIMAEYISHPGIPSLLGSEIPLEGNLATQKVIETRKRLVITDPKNNALTEASHDLMQKRGIETILILPLIVSGEVIGTVGVDILEKDHDFSDNQIDLIETIILQAATAIDNARLFDRVETALNETQALYDASAELNAVNSFDDILAVLRSHTLLAEADNNISINIFDRPWSGNDMPDWTITISRWSKLPSDAVSDRYPLKAFPAAQSLLKASEPTIIEDVANQPDLDEATRALYLEQVRAGSTIFVPLTIAGQWIGYINGIYSQPRHFFSDQVRRLTTLASQATVAIQNIQLLEETRRQLRDLGTISNASQTLSSAPLEIGGVAEIIAQIFIEVLGGNSTATITLRESEFSDQMKTVTSLQKSDDEIIYVPNLEQWDFNLRDYPATQIVMENLEPLVINLQDPNADPAELAFMAKDNVQQMIIIPLAIKGQSIGVLELEYLEETRPPTSDELNLVMTLANQAAVALENARLYEDQRQTAEQLREIDTLKSQFLANMSHELRTPLNSIIGFSRVIMKGIDGPVSDLQQQDLSAIYNAGQHLLNMINDILDISKIEAGKMELAFDDVDIKNVVESVLSTARGLVKDKPVQLITAIEEDLPIITADPTRVRQILLNLISNAAKFTDDGSITVTASKRINQQERQEIYISVIDTGPGIGEEDQRKLFIPFSQVDGSPTRKVGGTGLGLSITRLLVELHGGEIGVNSVEEMGSTFWFTLPLPETSIEVDASDTPTVLAIDDDVQVINLYERYLSDAGYQVIAVTNPHEALEQAREIMPFAITLDIMMPDFDGWKLLEDLKSDPKIGHIPVVICSILAEHDKGMTLGATDYLTKPILEDDLVHALEKLRNFEG